MIDEELAEEYSKGLCKTCTVDTCRYNTLQTCAIKESIKQAFLAGLKAKTQWHDLREDPNDLPNENKNYIVAFIGAKGSNSAGKICSSEEYFDAEVMRWRDRETFEDLHYLNDNDNIVLAWCEIPTFDKE